MHCVHRDRWPPASMCPGTGGHWPWHAPGHAGFGHSVPWDRHGAGDGVWVLHFRPGVLWVQRGGCSPVASGVGGCCVSGPPSMGTPCHRVVAQTLAACLSCHWPWGSALGDPHAMLLEEGAPRWVPGLGVPMRSDWDQQDGTRQDGAPGSSRPGQGVPPAISPPNPRLPGCLPWELDPPHGPRRGPGCASCPAGLARAQQAAPALCQPRGRASPPAWDPPPPSWPLLTPQTVTHQAGQGAARDGLIWKLRCQGKGRSTLPRSPAVGSVGQPPWAPAWREWGCSRGSGPQR